MDKPAAFIVWGSIEMRVAAGPFVSADQAEAARTSIFGKRSRAGENDEPRLAIVQVPA
jgi:hypothetical protein